MNDLVGATLFSVIASSLEAHVREALRKGWAQPVQLHREDGQRSMHMEGMWPYWLNGCLEATMRNDLDLSSMVILTGLPCLPLCFLARTVRAVLRRRLSMSGSGRAQHGGQVHGDAQRLRGGCAGSLWLVCACGQCDGTLHGCFHAAFLLRRLPAGGALRLCGGDE